MSDLFHFFFLELNKKLKKSIVSYFTLILKESR